MKVLVTGGTGFIGRNIAERLAKRGDMEVHATHFRSPKFPNDRIRWREWDLRDGPNVWMIMHAGYDVVIHAAATTSGAKDISERPHIHVTDNAIMGSLLLRAAFEHNVKHFIFLSCSTMYEPCLAPVSEDEPDVHIEPPYFGAAWTKVYLERMCEFFSRQGDARFTVLRHSNTYGPHDKFFNDKSHVTAALISKALTGDTINVWGAGTEKRDLLYIDDLVDAVEASLIPSLRPFERFNIGSGEMISVLDIARKIIDIVGPRIVTCSSERGGQHGTALNCDKAGHLLGWAPKVDLDAGLRRTIDWVRLEHDLPLL